MRRYEARRLQKYLAEESQVSFSLKKKYLNVRLQELRVSKSRRTIYKQTIHWICFTINPNTVGGGFSAPRANDTSSFYGVETIGKTYVLWKLRTQLYPPSISTPWCLLRSPFLKFIVYLYVYYYIYFVHVYSTSTSSECGYKYISILWKFMYVHMWTQLDYILMYKLL